MKKRQTLCMMTAFLAAAAAAQVRTACESRGKAGTGTVRVEEPSATRAGKYVCVDMRILLGGLSVGRDGAVTLTPRLTDGKRKADLKSVGVYGRRMYYASLRVDGGMLTGKGEESYKASGVPGEVEYRDMVPYEEWMDGAALTLLRADYGCCGAGPSEEEVALAGLSGGKPAAEETGPEPAVERTGFFPELVYMFAPSGAADGTAEVTASVYFRAGKAAVDPDYAGNAAELGKIASAVAPAPGRDAAPASVRIEGHASPEGPPDVNARLAAARAEALKHYVLGHSGLDGRTIRAEASPDGRAEARAWVEKSSLEHRAGILAVMDGKGDAAAKEKAARAAYPEEYRRIADECYPRLRRADFHVSYAISPPSGTEAAKRMLKENPGATGLQGIYMAAQGYEPGSEAFRGALETAARLFPSDASANVNAANAAMLGGDLAAAEGYLARAGSGPEAAYARGALAVLKGDVETARRYFVAAKDLGVAQAARTLEELDKGRTE